MKRPRVHRLLAGILCAAMITQNLTVTSLASEPDPVAAQELEEETELEESTDAQFSEIYQALTQLLSKPEPKPRKPIGYRTYDE